MKKAKKQIATAVLVLVMTLALTLGLTVVSVLAAEEQVEFGGNPIHYDTTSTKVTWSGKNEGEGDLIFSFTKTTKFALPADTFAWVLVVGGGGSGSSGKTGFYGNGGNAGDVIEKEAIFLPKGVYSITVGAGGAVSSGSGSENADGADGSPSSVVLTSEGEFEDIEAQGGAGGSGASDSIMNATAGEGDEMLSTITGKEVTYGVGGSPAINGSASPSTANTGNGGQGGYNTGLSAAGAAGVVIIRLFDLTVYTTVAFSAEGKEIEDFKIEDAMMFSPITLPEYVPSSPFLFFEGWSDGQNVYSAGASYTVLFENVKFTAVFSDPAISGLDLLPAAELKLLVYLKLPDAIVANGSMFTANVYKAGELVEKIPLANKQKTAFGDYEIPVKIFAKQMTEAVTIVIDSGAESREIGPVSIQEYAKLYFKQSNNEKGIALLKAMLNYGAACQTQFQYNTENLANSILEEGDKTGLVDPESIDVGVDFTSFLDKWISYVGMSVYAEEIPKMVVEFELLKDNYEKYEDINDYTVSVEYMDKDELVVLTDGTVEVDKNHRIKVYINGIPPRLAGTSMDIRFHNKEDEEFYFFDVIVSRSLNYYAKNVLLSKEATEAQKATASALYLYGVASKNFYK